MCGKRGLTSDTVWHDMLEEIPPLPRPHPQMCAVCLILLFPCIRLPALFWRDVGGQWGTSMDSTVALRGCEKCYCFLCCFLKLVKKIKKNHIISIPSNLHVWLVIHRHFIHFDWLNPPDEWSLLLLLLFNIISSNLITIKPASNQCANT